MFQFEHPCVLMQTGLKFGFTVKTHMPWHTAQLQVFLLMKIIQNYSIAKINSMQLLLFLMSHYFLMLHFQFQE